MWAGGRIRFLAPLRSGDAVSRTSTILNVTEKQGGSGRLVFVTVGHRIEGPAGLAVEEEQDIVYRGAEGVAVKAATKAPDAPPGAIEVTVIPDPVLLFRYSALTGNGHRIHYDMDYVRHEEGYPGLIVHGPLQATWLAGLLAGRPITQFTFRGRRPAVPPYGYRVGRMGSGGSCGPSTAMGPFVWRPTRALKSVNKVATKVLAPWMVGAIAARGAA
jgi:hydroxyacyl-ACP dehydratase HTD2-like protein with hotdog domain